MSLRRLTFSSVVLRAGACVAGALAGTRLAAQDGFPSDGMAFEAVRPAPVFFPPTPPPLGRPVSRLTAPAVGRQPPPPELAAHVNEIFYPLLSTRLAKNNLPENLRQKINAYRTAKVAAQTELRHELARTHDLPPAERRAALDTLARKQTPVIAQLEQTAEEIRTELNTGNTDWSTYREWRLGNTMRGDRGDSPNEVAQVMRATAYYQAGLLPAQRRLLREISLEVTMSAEDEAKAAAAQPFLFFPPEPARVMLPDDMPADLAALVGDFQTQKSALKKELFDLTYAEDNATFGFTRTAKFKSLAAAQAPRLAALEQLAEKIRDGLRQLPDSTPPPAHSPLPVALTDRTIAFFQHRVELQNETRDKLDEIGLQLRELGAQLGYRFDGESITTVVAPSRRGAPLSSAENTRLTELKAKISAIEAGYRTRIESLAAELADLRRDTGQFLGRTDPDRVDTTLNEVARYMALRDNEDGYHDYRTAVFEPGLSPGQRRLLFDGAMEKLALPLPRSELQPVRRAASW